MSGNGADASGTGTGWTRLAHRQPAGRPGRLSRVGPLGRLGRRRRLIATVVAGFGVLSAYIALRPTHTPSVLVATHDLSPGVLKPGDLRPAALSPPPSGAVRSGAIGRVLAGAMRRGEPLTDVRLLHSLPLPPGTVATPVRLADPDTAQLIAPGSTIGVLAAWEGQPAQLVADDVTVVTIPKADNDHGALIVLATTPSQATQLAAAQAGGRLSITIKPYPE